MNIIDIITKKKNKEILSYDEIKYAVNEYLKDNVKDYQMSSLLMSIVLNGMSEEETFNLTKIMIESGDVIDLSSINGTVVDKHSTGGVGDKTTMVIAPIVASLNVPVVKMSGRGLGFTGGTIDKLESIPGFTTNLSEEEMKKQAKEIGIVVASQTANLTPLDKKIYALRDVTATVESIPLIATSIMSKKIASGADKILIDIKVGKGALLKTLKDAKKLSEIMKKIGDFYGREVRCLITDMSNPLGRSIGNSLEVLEAIDILKGNEVGVLTDLCIELSSNMVSMGLNISLEEAEKMVKEAISSKKAYQKFLEFVKRQHGDIEKLQVSSKTKEIKSSKEGTLKAIDALEIGKLSVSLGAGRQAKEDVIDPGVGIKLNRLVNDKVSKGDTLCTIYMNKEINLENIENIFTIE